MPQELSRPTSKTAPMEKAVLLLVDDDQLITESLSFILKKKYQVYIAANRQQAKDILSSLKHPPQLALIDLGLPPLPHQADEGFDLIGDLLRCDSTMKIIVLSDQNEEMNIQHALTLGAVDYLSKPVESSLLQNRLQHHLMLQHVEKQKENDITNTAVIGESSVMLALRQQLAQFSTSLFPVLIDGEPGTGKELIARLLHEQSTNNANVYVEINCAVSSASLLESQIFGYIKRTPGNSIKLVKGAIAEAENGTLFLDQIDEMPDKVQVKFHKFLKTGDYSCVGGTENLKSTLRIITASNKNLLESVNKGKFRAELYHRLSVLRVVVPALRERGNDSMLLRMHFQNLYEKSIKHFSLNSAANKLWIEYDYPGNVRELKNVVIRLGTRYPGRIITREILETEFEVGVVKNKVEALRTGFSAGSFNDLWLMKEIKSGKFVLDEAIVELENHCIKLAMAMYDGNISKVSEVLHVSREELYRRVQSKTGKKDK